MLKVIAFDLAWAGKIGWARLSWGAGRYTHFETGIIKPYYRVDKPVYQAKRAAGIVDELLLVLRSNHVAAYDRVVFAYETPLHWLLSASKRKKRKGPPVTRNSLLGMAFAVNCFHVAMGQYLSGCGRDGKDWFDVRAVDTQTARSAFGVHDLTALAQPRIRELAVLPGYADAKKACVGAALEIRLQHEGLGGLAIETDHEADAGVFAFYVADEEILRM